LGPKTGFKWDETSRIGIFGGGCIARLCLLFWFLGIVCQKFKVPNPLALENAREGWGSRPGTVARGIKMVTPVG
jgi:hypothetical protein